MKFYNYDIVFQEIPDEVTLAINITHCPNHCVGCHSPHLWDDIGHELNEEVIDTLTSKYKNLITCVCLMGGDRQWPEVKRLMGHVRRHTKLHTAWYSGREQFPDAATSTASSSLSLFDYVKLGPYRPDLGGLKSKTTNQRMYRVDKGKMVDITNRFWPR